MAGLIIIASVTLIILLLMLQKLSLRFIYNGEFSIEADYSFFTLVIKKDKKSRTNANLGLNSILPIKRAFDFIIERSEIEVSSLKLASRKLPPHKFSVRYKNVFSILSVISAYLARKAKKLSLKDNAVILISDDDKEQDYDIDLSVKAPLYIAIAGAAMFFLISKESKRKTDAKRG